MAVSVQQEIESRTRSARFRKYSAVLDTVAMSTATAAGVFVLLVVIGLLVGGCGPAPSSAPPVQVTSSTRSPVPTTTRVTTPPPTTTPSPVVVTSTGVFIPPTDSRRVPITTTRPATTTTTPPAAPPPVVVADAPDTDLDHPQAAYYPNCAAAKKAGAAPIRKGEPGYRKGLDRDGDGTACDK